MDDDLADRLEIRKRRLTICKYTPAYNFELDRSITKPKVIMQVLTEKL